MTTYHITNTSDYTEHQIFESTSDNPYAEALDILGFCLDHTTDDGNVHEYKILDKESRKSVGGLMEYMYYRACFAALDVLGYDCQEDYIPNTQFNINTPSFQIVNDDIIVHDYMKANE